jgi:uncharacterized protein YndB with AHSA1/START domain
VKNVVLRSLPLALAVVASAAFAVSPTPVHKSAIVAAPPADVWAAWTTTEGIRTFLAPDGRVEGKPGGAYEVWFTPEAPAGARGCDGCTVVSVDPPKKLVFTWSYPPSLPELRDTGAKGRVTVELLPGSVSGTTLVTLAHDGFPEGEAGEKGRAYFDKAWDVVLSRLRERFIRGPVDWSKK